MSDLWGEEEDNNPYGSFTRHDSTSSADERPGSPTSRFARPSTPPSPSYPTQDPSTERSHTQAAGNDSSEDTDTLKEAPSRRKQGGYDSRVEQLLYERPDLTIAITHAGKNVEGGGSYIAYTIRTGDLEVRRRYRDFASLRETLVSLHPTLIIPPIPEKHSFADYAAKPTKAKEDEVVIEHRKRMLTSFLNRCRRMQEVREDGVFWKFLDPNASWNEVLHSHPVSSLPKNNLKAPPLDPANPTPGHSFLPVPSSNAKLKSQTQKESRLEPSGTPTAPPPSASYPSAAAHTTAGPQIFGRFPPQPQNLSEQELDPYFVNFEAASRELETLLQGNMEKVNRRTLSHLGSLAEDMSELGARLNGFSLSEQSATLAAAIEKVGQAVDSTYIATGDMSASLGANFSDPMRESAQFAGIVRNVLRFRILKRIQSEMTKDELEKKRTLLDQLERSELEAQRIEEHLERSGFVQQTPPRRSNSARSSSERPRIEEDTASIDSDFPQGEPQATPSASQGLPPKSEPSSPTHRRGPSGNFVTNKIFGRLNHAIHGIVDVDPERTRRDQIGKTRESLAQLEQAIGVSEKDVKDASTGVLKSLQQFQSEKENDLRRYMMAYARVHIDWAKRNLSSWEEAKTEVEQIDFAARPLCRQRHPPPLPAVWAAFQGSSNSIPFTTSSNKPFKKPRHTYSRRASNSYTTGSYDLQSDVFLIEEQPSALASPGSSPPSLNSGPSQTPRFIPPHLKEEVIPPAVTSRGSGNAGWSSADAAGMTVPDRPPEDSANDANRAERGSSPSVGFTDSMRQMAVEARSSSPAKRSASEFEEQEGERENGVLVRPTDSPVSAGKKSVSQIASPMPSRFKPVPEPAAEQDDKMLLDEEENVSALFSNGGSDDNSSRSNGVNRRSSPPTSNSAQSVDQELVVSVEHTDSKKLPSYDEQINTVRETVQNAVDEEGSRGYLISTRWINRVEARTTSGVHASYGKELREGEVGPVDNSNIAHNDHLYGDLRMASGEPFVPLREGLSPSTDFEIIPQQAWDMIVAWYGVAEDSHIMVRYMHSTSPEPGAIGANMQYELYPPICTIQTLRNDRSGSSLGGLKRQDSLAPNIVVSRSDTLRTFFQQLKTVAEIDLQTRIRVWRLLETGSTSLQNSKMPTPASSRAASPITSDQLPQTRPNLVVDPASFLALEEGTHRERLDLSDDAVYDTSGSQATLNTVGLPSYCTLILDEQLSGAQKEEYVSDSVRLNANADTKKGLDGTQNLLKPRARHGDGRRSPTPSGIMTRGRTNKKGRTRGATGLTNLGNSCYMNSALQCVRSIEELSIYFLAQKHLTEINENNPLGHKGQMVKAYGGFISSIYSPDSSGSFPPRNFKNTLGKCQPLFSGYGQQDSQEFLSFLVDGLHEDLNRVHKKPYMENPESDDRTVHDPQAVRELGEKFRANHKARNDSVAMDLFNGFYKNTMICPNCDKVSVTFDPYSLLTLQLPIASTFQHQFGFMPLRGRPRYLDVDIDKNSTFRTLKEWIGKRVKVSADRLVVVEEYNQKLYLVFEDASVLSESNLQPADLLWVYELDESPTNWPPAGTRKNRSYGMLNSGNDDIPDMTSPLADRMAVPLLHRGTTKYGSKFDLPPSCVLITRDEAKDADKILRKVLQKVQTLTTRPLFDEAGMQRGTRSQEASDTEVMHDDDGLSTDDSRVQARSIEGEDGLVDVSVGPPTDKSFATSTSNGDVSVKTEPDILDPATYIFPEFRQLFDIKIAPPSGRIIPAGMSFGDGTRCQTLSHRVQNQPSGVSRRRVSNASRRSALESGSSEDELARDDGHAGFGAATPPESDDDMMQAKSPTIKKVGQLGSVARKPGAAPVSDSQMEYLIQLGEALVLDWSEQGYDLLFGDNRGTRTDQNLDLIPDPELDEKKARRASRKKNGVSLEECFEETAKSEVLSEDNAWYCGRCKELRRATKKLEIWTVPDILVIHLKRFSSQSRLRDKIDVLVDFPTEGLDLEHKVGLPDGKSLTYDLFAVDNHYGGLGGGHYTAYAQNFFNKQWYEYNDQMVSATKPEGVVTRAAYLLFYRRRSDRPLGGKYLEEVVNDAYAATDSITLSGEDSRPGDSISNGSSENSQEAGTATGAGANHQGAQRIGSLNGYRHDLADIAKNAQDSGEDGDTLEPPPYNDDRFDEGFFDQGQDDPMPSLEADQQGFVGPLGLQPEATWNFDSLQQQGPTASPASSNMNMDDDRSGELNGESQHTRIAQDFGDDGELDNQFDDSDGLGGHGVEHISAYNDDADTQDGPVTEIKLGSDDEGSSRGRH